LDGTLGCVLPIQIEVVRVTPTMLVYLVCS
jgi:hypothetical protein